MSIRIARRDLLIAGAGLPLLGAGKGARMNTRKIPRTGEELPVIGLGTWQTFDVAESKSDRAPLMEVLGAFFAAGARVIDSSPMYGRAERVVGDLLRQMDARSRAFLATKVWTSGEDKGIEQMKDSMRKMAAGERIELMQVHNLVDWRTHLPTLRKWKEEGRVRYIGITHYQLSAMDEMARILREEKVDFVQLPYSVVTREAESRLLPTARDTGTAVLVMRPFESGDLFRRTRGRPIPGFARELGVESWAQYFLKFILGHPAVTCPIPATSKTKRLHDNLQAGFGRYPEEPALRKKWIDHLGL